MASSSGSSPANVRLLSNAGRLLLAFVFALATQAAAAPLPDYLRAALARFAPDVPAGWAYTLTTRRNEARMVERYDPSRPPAARWTLLEWQGRAPTAEELEKYVRSRPQGDSGGARANFNKDDIEPGLLVLAREDDAQAEWTGAFRETSAGTDKMLAHLTLRLVVDKRTPHIAEYGLTLPEPYSPVLGVKMNRLNVIVRYHPPTADRPALPADQVSQFAGRMLFIATEEQLELTYSDYAPPPPELSR